MYFLPLERGVEKKMEEVNQEWSDFQVNLVFVLSWVGFSVTEWTYFKCFQVVVFGLRTEDLKTEMKCLLKLMGYKSNCMGGFLSGCEKSKNQIFPSCSIPVPLKAAPICAPQSSSTAILLLSEYLLFKRITS